MALVHRKGLGKAKHIDLQYLWVQNELARGRSAIKKVPADTNPADLMITMKMDFFTVLFFGAVLLVALF